MGIFDEDKAVLSVYDDYSTAWSALNETITDYRNGVSEMGDVSRAMSNLRSYATAVIEEIDSLNDYRENAETVTSSIYRMVRASQALVNTIKQNVSTSFEVQTLNWTDIYTIALEYYDDTSRTDELIERNSLLDPLAIAPGTVLTLPYDGVVL
jgi:prophage DNA circulation protein